MSYQLGARANGVKQNIALITLHLDKSARSAIDVGCNEGVITAQLDALGLAAVGFEADAGYADTARQFQQQNFSSAEISQHALTLDDLKALPEVDVVLFLSVNQQLAKLFSTSYSEAFFVQLFEKASLQLFFQPCLIHEKYGSAQGFTENDALSAKEYYDNLLYEKGFLFTSQLVGLSENNLPVSEPFRPLIVYHKKGSVSTPLKRPQLSDSTQSIRSSVSKLCHIPLDAAVGSKDLQRYAPGVGWHRFTATATFIFECIQSSRPINYREAPLYQYYQSCQPTCFGDLWQQLGYTADIGVLSQMPLDRYVSWLPWFDSSDSIEDMQAGQSKAALIPDWDSHAFGPQSDAQVLAELKRLRNLVMVISQEGYTPELKPDGYIRGYILKHQQDARFVVTAGQHRLAVMAALGFKSAMIKFQPGYERVIDSSEVQSWPLVKSGVYTEEQALAIFHGVFEATGSGML
ncbi:methyltransferase domain-containing protein [Alkalimonas mucilaginosa]|uniref:Methyltransferase domain-containing protein n=1 Tax=Alkalimonas mucilaginosa TaxID=3057676 RepID=A0ABU7JK66_9GAMM|nr:hypothetical protein [Alkalimonas sp. MEB004]MEE2025821.1 hypothetical protein [Alkalimonas sp. MEB004]